MNCKGIILFDIDKTLVDTNYSLTTNLDLWRQAVMAAQNKNWLLGLNSDSGFETIRQKLETWGMNGPIISERGALVHLPDGTRGDTSGNVWLTKIPQLRDAFTKQIQQNGWRVFFNLNDKEMEFCPEEPLIVINTLRERSLGFFTRQMIPNQGIIKHRPSLQLVAEKLRFFLKENLTEEEFASLEWDINPEYCVGIVHHCNTLKKHGAAWLMKKFGLDQLFMVGDSINDWMNIPGVVHCGVGNASTEFLEKCQITTKRPITLGSIDILNQITCL